MEFSAQELSKILRCDLFGPATNYKLHRLVRLYRMHLKTQNVFDDSQMSIINALFGKLVACHPNENRNELRTQLYRLVDEIERLSLMQRLS